MDYSDEIGRYRTKNICIVQSFSARRFQSRTVLVNAIIASAVHSQYLSLELFIFNTLRTG